MLEITGTDAVKYEQGGLTFVKNRIGSTEAAERDLGFKAKVGLEQGMKQLIEWRRTHVQDVEARRAAVVD